MSEPKLTTPRLSERQIKNFHTRYTKDSPDRCWEWIGSTNDRDYGVLKSSGRKNVEEYRAHRIAYWLHHGHWPTQRILHHCDNPPCVNPSHLYEGDMAENMEDRDARNRTALGESNGKSKLLVAEVREIRIALANKERVSSIARRYNVGHSTIASIVAGRSWKWLH